MRPTTIAGLVMLWLLTNATLAFSQGKPEIHYRESHARIKLVSEENAPNPIWQADGWGKTEQDAINVALEQLCDDASTYLFQKGLRDWRPGLSDIKALMKPVTKTEQSNFEDERLGNLHHVTVEVELTPVAMRGFQRQARDQRSSLRMMALGKGLGMLVALLVAFGGYFRLEEATKGYYTTWLRLTAVGFIGAAATSLWFLA